MSEKELKLMSIHRNSLRYQLKQANKKNDEMLDHIEVLQTILKKKDQEIHGLNVAIDMQKAQILGLRYDLKNNNADLYKWE